MIDRILTQRGMLKGHVDNIFESLERWGSIGACETLSDDDLDTTEGVSGIPVLMVENLMVESGESQGILISVSIKI